MALMKLAERRPSLRVAAAAAAAGLAWGFLRHRNHPRRTALTALQAAQWFVAAGGAVAGLSLLRRSVEQAGAPDDGARDEHDDG